MARAKSRPEPLRLRGVPTDLEGVWRVDRDYPVFVPVELPVRGSRRGAPLKAQVSNLARGRAHVRLGLPPDTPVGTYLGSLRVADGELPIVVDVEPLVSLDVVPSVLRVTAEPGERIARSVTLVNEGNTPIEVPRVATFGLFEESAVDAAIGHAFGTKEAEGRRLEAFGDEIANRYGGGVRVAIRSESKNLDPGEAADLELELRLPAGLSTGREYFGSWDIKGATVTVELTVSRKARGRRQEAETE